MENSAEAAQVEMVELLGVSAVDSPGLAGVKERGRYHCKVDLQLSSEADVSHSQTFLQRLPKAPLVLAILLLTSASMYTTL